MTWIKICGTTNLEDAQLAAEAGADALGFIFAPSPRRIDPAAAAKIIRALPPAIERVGVFVDESAQRVRTITAQTGLSGVQFHRGIESAKELKTEMPALHVTEVLSVPELEESTGFSVRDDARKWVDRFMFDNGGGGTGRTFNWKDGVHIVRALSTAGKGIKIIIAGGLTPNNVGDAIRLFRPWGVDVVSGVEAKPGKKNPHKLRDFIQAVREADKAT